MSLPAFLTALDALVAEASQSLTTVGDVEGLEELRVRFTGAKNGQLKSIQKMMGSLQADERPAAGKRFNEVRDAVQAALDDATARLQSSPAAKKSLGPMLDPTLPGVRPRLGHLHPITQTIEHLKQHQPECLIGHNLINFDLPFLADRCRIHNISHPFRKGNKISRITSSTVNGQPIEFTPIYWNGVNILDTYQQIAIWDKQAAKLARYDLKSSVIALGLRDDRRLELSVNEIKDCWAAGDTETIENYLKFDL